MKTESELFWVLCYVRKKIENNYETQPFWKKH